METYRDRERTAARRRAKKLLSACKARLAAEASGPKGEAPSDAPVRFEVVAPELVPDLAQFLKQQNLTDAEVE